MSTALVKQKNKDVRLLGIFQLSRLQKMVFSNGTPKGIRQVLTERGINTTGMKASDL